MANSKTFQKFAVRTESHLQNLKQGGRDKLNSQLDELHKAASEAAFSSTSSSKSSGSRGMHTNGGPPIPPKQGFAGFISAFGKEIRKDLGFK